LFLIQKNPKKCGLNRLLKAGLTLKNFNDGMAKRYGQDAARLMREAEATRKRKFDEMVEESDRLLKEEGMEMSQPKEPGEEGYGEVLDDSDNDEA
jgi:hypothetical protein